MLYLYESHMGGLYWSEEDYDYESMYCETCGDSDMQLGTAENYLAAMELLDENSEHYIDEHISELAGEAYEYFKNEAIE